MKKKIELNILHNINKIINNKKVALHEPQFFYEDIESVNKAIKSTYVSSSGKYVDLFEKKLSKFTNSKYVVATVNGTSALHIALIINKLKPNEEVLLPSMSFIASANAISYCGATPHFVDIEEKTLGIDVKKLEKYLKKITKINNGSLYNKKTKRKISGIIPVHLFGHPSNILELIKLAKKFNLFLIEDAAEGLGSFYKKKHVGTFGNVGILSFNGNKIITTGGGGAILTNNKKIALLARHLSTTAKLPHKWNYNHNMIGYNYRMPNLNAALGCSQFIKLKTYLEKKRNLFQRYSCAFQNNQFFEIYKEPVNCKSNYWLQALVIKKEHSKYKEFLLKTLNENNIMSRPAWSLIHTLKSYKKNPRMKLEKTYDLFNRIINIPSSPNL